MRVVCTLPAGASFGELALIRKQPRVGSIRCVERCYFGVLVKKDYRRILLKIHEEYLLKILNLLQK